MAKSEQVPRAGPAWEGLMDENKCATGSDRTLLLIQNAQQKRDAANKAGAYSAGSYWQGWIEGARMALVDSRLKSHDEIESALADHGEA